MPGPVAPSLTRGRELPLRPARDGAAQPGSGHGSESAVLGPVVESRTGAVAWALCGNAPFPVPAHQTGRADLSGSSAISGFRPHRSHRAALPQWALQDGPEADESSVPRLMEDRLRQWEGGQDRLVGCPVHPAFLASLAEHLPPQPDDAVLEHAQGSIVEDHAVVPVVTPQDL